MGIGAEILSVGTGAIATADTNFQGKLAADGLADDPAALIDLQYQAFIFTNTVSTVSGSLGAISSATQSAASKVGS